MEQNLYYIFAISIASFAMVISLGSFWYSRKSYLKSEKEFKHKHTADLLPIIESVPCPDPNSLSWKITIHNTGTTTFKLFRLKVHGDCKLHCGSSYMIASIDNLLKNPVPIKADGSHSIIFTHDFHLQAPNTSNVGCRIELENAENCFEEIVYPKLCTI
jgi:hypothetical protein